MSSSSSQERIAFRSSYETDSHARYLNTDGGVLSVAEAKVLIAKELGLEREFARKFDLKLINASDQMELNDDSAIIHPGASLVVQRTLWRPVEDVKEKAKPFVSDWIQGSETLVPGGGRPPPKESLPQRYICAACKGLLRTAMAVRCANSCNVSVCKVCAEQLLRDSNPPVCPECQTPNVKNFIMNKALIAIINQLQLTSRYALPVRLGTELGIAAQPPDMVDYTTSQAPIPAVQLEQQAAEQAASFLVFVRPEQISVIHTHGFLFVSEEEKDFIDDLYLSTLPVVLFLFASGGGGTSLCTPGIAKVTQISGGSRNIPAPGAAVEVVHLEPVEEQQFRAQWFENPDETTNSIWCRLEWTLKYDSMVLLPGKAQPIAGIRATRKHSAQTAPSGFEAIRLSVPQKLSMNQRLTQEGVFARMNRQATSSTAPPPPPKPLTPPPGGGGMGKTASSSLIDAASVVSGSFVFDPASNAWTGKEPAASSAPIIHPLPITTPPSTQWKSYAPFFRTCVGPRSYFSRLDPGDTKLHWSLTNPLLPFAAFFPKLTRQTFNVLSRIQSIALRSLADGSSLMHGEGYLNQAFTSAPMELLGKRRQTGGISRRHQAQHIVTPIPSQQSSALTPPPLATVFTGTANRQISPDRPVRPSVASRPPDMVIRNAMPPDQNYYRPTPATAPPLYRAKGPWDRTVRRPQQYAEVPQRLPPQQQQRFTPGSVDSSAGGGMIWPIQSQVPPVYPAAGGMVNVPPFGGSFCAPPQFHPVPPAVGWPRPLSQPPARALPHPSTFPPPFQNPLPTVYNPPRRVMMPTRGGSLGAVYPPYGGGGPLIRHELDAPEFFPPSESFYSGLPANTQDKRKSTTQPPVEEKLGVSRKRALSKDSPVDTSGGPPILRRATESYTDSRRYSRRHQKAADEEPDSTTESIASKAARGFEDVVTRESDRRRARQQRFGTNGGEKSTAGFLMLDEFRKADMRQQSSSSGAGGNERSQPSKAKPNFDQTPNAATSSNRVSSTGRQQASAGAVILPSSRDHRWASDRPPSDLKSAPSRTVTEGGFHSRDRLVQQEGTSLKKRRKDDDVPSRPDNNHTGSIHNIATLTSSRAVHLVTGRGDTSRGNGRHVSTAPESPMRAEVTKNVFAAEERTRTPSVTHSSRAPPKPDSDPQRAAARIFSASLPQETHPVRSRDESRSSPASSKRRFNKAASNGSSSCATPKSDGALSGGATPGGTVKKRPRNSLYT